MHVTSVLRLYFLCFHYFNYALCLAWKLCRRDCNMFVASFRQNVLQRNCHLPAPGVRLVLRRAWLQHRLLQLLPWHSRQPQHLLLLERWWLPDIRRLEIAISIYSRTLQMSSSPYASCVFILFEKTEWCATLNKIIWENSSCSLPFLKTKMDCWNATVSYWHVWKRLVWFTKTTIMITIKQIKPRHKAIDLSAASVQADALI